MNLLMMYTSMPHTTGAYLERSLRQVAAVRTFGPAIPPDAIRAWDLGAIADRVCPHDLECREGSTEEAFSGLGGFRPDWLLFVETGIWFDMPILDDAPWPKACYLIDTHLNPLDHLMIANRFDVVFLAQKAYVDLFRTTLSRPVFWLPLAADPTVHRKVRAEECFDVGICGSGAKPGDRRGRRLARLGIHYSVGEKRAFFEEMASFLSRCRILFNSAVSDDLNMRVFESLSIGKCLLTDPVPGLFDLFVPDQDLVLYEDGDLVEKVRFLLDNPDLREKIAENGRNKVLARHTYRHRARSIVRMLAESPRVMKDIIDKGEEHATHSYV